MERIRRLAAQHAETARLLGVDCVPCYRSTPPPSRASRTLERPAASQATIGEARPDVSATSLPEGTLVADAEPAPAEVVAAPPAVAGSGGSPARSRDAAQAQARLDEIRARYERDAPHAAFVTAHTRIVFGEGDPCARLMFIGEAPGEEEDKTGRPFVGRAGQLLDKMIVAMGLSRSSVYIANVLKTRPPGNATPTCEEARLCAPYLFDQIEAVEPEVIVTLGLPATRTLLDVQDAMARLRGRWWGFRDPRRVQAREVPVMPTYHPAFLLRQYTPENRGKVWSDLQLVITRLGLSAPARKDAPG